MGTHGSCSTLWDALYTYCSRRHGTRLHGNFRTQTVGAHLHLGGLSGNLVQILQWLHNTGAHLAVIAGLVGAAVGGWAETPEHCEWEVLGYRCQNLDSKTESFTLPDFDALIPWVLGFGVVGVVIWHVGRSLLDTES
jgi:hypothetical protein